MFSEIYMKLYFKLCLSSQFHLVFRKTLNLSLSILQEVTCGSPELPYHSTYICLFFSLLSLLLNSI